MSHDDARTAAQRQLRRLLDPVPTAGIDRPGYIDLLGEAPQAGRSTGLAQRLMRAAVVSRVYDRWWRPALGRIAKGPRGPSMSEEHRVATELLGLAPGHVVLDVACGTGVFTPGFAGTVGPEGHEAPHRPLTVPASRTAHRDDERACPQYRAPRSRPRIRLQGRSAARDPRVMTTRWQALCVDAVDPSAAA